MVTSCVARGGPCHVAGRSLQASMPSAHSEKSALRPPGYAGFLRRLHDTGHPERRRTDARYGFMPVTSSVM
jgi:hypothetical protein